MAHPTVLLIRALLLRCPACGSGGLFSAWFRMREACPGCGLRMEREEGYFLGAIMFNLVFAELLFAAVLTVVVVWTWPNPPWDDLWIGGVLGMVLFPLVLYPFSKTLWLAFDLLFRPAAVRDFEDRRSNPVRPDR